MPDAPAGVTANEDDDDKPLTAAQTKALIKAEIQGGVNAAMTSHGKRQEKALAGLLETSLLPFKELLEGRRAEQEAAPARQQQEPHGQPRPVTSVLETQQQGQPQQKPQVDPAFEALQKRTEAMAKEMADLRKQGAAAEAKAKAAEQKRIETEAYTTVKAALAGKVKPGLDQDLLDLMVARKKLVIGEDGVPRLRLRATADEPEEGLDLEDGLRVFLDPKHNPTVSHYLPAPNAGPPAGKRPTPPAPTAPINGRPPAARQPPKPSPTSSAERADRFKETTGQDMDSLI